jgi:hypothetical protein
MENPLTVTLWVAVALYAVVSVCGVIVFHDALPNTQKLTDGYGVGYATTDAAETRNGERLILIHSTGRVSPIPGIKMSRAN